MAKNPKSESIITGLFRLAFPQTFEPKASQQGGKEKYSITLLFPKGDKDAEASVTAIRKLIFETAKAAWGADRAKWPGMFKTLNFKDYVSPTGKDGFPIRDGDHVHWDGFAGHWFIRATSQYPIPAVNAKRQDILRKADIFGGLICRARVNVFAYDNSGNRGFSLGTDALQVVRDDGTRFGAGGSAADAFDDSFAGADDPSNYDDGFGPAPAGAPEEEFA